ncbi:winged helix-turn-helix domain-containing tetratricopeptide repeat protein [Mesorhizobium sp. B4-1-4]|uniref:winged helix-turn-helix domain-containing tetratricopeptide repeat protein n=1 Tax=Mesorhizobium sp. B4-1-4 TaxID=2589888 RepID=UPI00112A3862|nr:winged helix-turn-helix domain-containing tetratricopeptide repeat protein [Mesorhizobium sp. B4-1-4]UCI34504.1 winged helix-turn-helix domain-containing tetratricopeptide repeat protein [Mesorhizobium sp. B4-1-4]
MSKQATVFGPFTLDPYKGTLLREGEPVALGRRGILLLDALLKRQGEILTKTELMDAGWQGSVVEESNLSVQIALLRKALGPMPDGGEWIATVPRIGYRFLGPGLDEANKTVQPQAKPSLAVLPLTSLSTDIEQEYFADGLAEEIITMLSKLSGLVVIARSSSFAYKGKSVDIRTVARDLGVRYVLAGSVRRSGSRLRIVAQLSDGETGAHIWAESYDRELADMFAVQEEVARKIVGELHIALNPKEAAQWPGITSAGTTDIEAYDCFLRGRAMQRGATQNADVFQRTAELFRKAIDHDPAYAAPYAALSMALAHAYYNRWVSDPGCALVEAGRLVDEAIDRDPNDPFPHGVAALVSMYRKDFERWAAEVEMSLTLNPNFAPSLSLRGMLNMYSGKPLAAIADMERAIRLDPLYSHLYLHHLGVAHLIAGKYETAAALLRERILLVPKTDMSRAYLAAVLGLLDHGEGARQVWSELMAVNPDYSFAEGIGQMPFRNPQDMERIKSGLQRAGLPV